MGRQIPIAATLLDKNAFLAFRRDFTTIRIAESAAPSTPELWIDRFSTEFAPHRQYGIWNTEFAWQPTYGRVNANVPGTGGLVLHRKSLFCIRRRVLAN